MKDENSITYFVPVEGKGVGKIRDKELYIGIKVIDLADGKEYVDCRVYNNKSSEVYYAIVWLTAKDVYARGVGKAGGSGYDHMSAAVADALYDAGVKLKLNISGVGQGAVEEALTLVAKELGSISSKVVVMRA